MAFVPEPKDAALEAIRSWSKMPRLAEFAVKRHGFGDSNGGFGVTYPCDDDPQEAEIPLGYVEVYGYWGPPQGYEILIPETLYLSVLADALHESGHVAESRMVRSLLASQRRA